MAGGIVRDDLMGNALLGEFPGSQRGALRARAGLIAIDVEFPARRLGGESNFLMGTTCERSHTTACSDTRTKGLTLGNKVIVPGSVSANWRKPCRGDPGVNPSTDIRLPGFVTAGTIGIANGGY